MVSKFTKYLRLLFLPIAVCALYTCKKYPEGPFISFRTREHRVAGDWTIQKYLVDGMDSTASKYPPGCTIGFGAKTGAGYLRHVSTNCEMTGGSWDFTDHHESIVVYAEDTTIKSSFFISSSNTWEILKLKYQEMHLQTEFNSRQYQIYLTRNGK